MTSDARLRLGKLIPVVIGDSCRGFLYRRRDKYEAFDIDVVSCGIFSTECEATAALFDSNKGGK